jgi:hypothetical protein
MYHKLGARTSCPHTRTELAAIPLAALPPDVRKVSDLPVSFNYFLLGYARDADVGEHRVKN